MVRRERAAVGGVRVRSGGAGGRPAPLAGQGRAAQGVDGEAGEQVGGVAGEAVTSRAALAVEALERREHRLDRRAAPGDQRVADLLPVRQHGDVLVAAVQDAEGPLGAAELVVEMLGGEAAVTLAARRSAPTTEVGAGSQARGQHLLDLIDRHAPARGLAEPPIEQGRSTLVLVPIPPPAEGPHAHPQDLRRLRLAQPALLQRP